jgi:hypothetical protein
VNDERWRKTWRALSYALFGLGGLATVVAVWHLYLLGTEPGVKTDMRAKTGAIFAVVAIVLVGLGAMLASRSRTDQRA